MLLVIVFFLLYKYLNIYFVIIYWFLVSIFGIDFIRNVYLGTTYLLKPIGKELLESADAKTINDSLGFMHLVKIDLIEIIIPFIKERKKKILIFIDNIDKCTVDKCVLGLEVIRLLTSFNNSNFIIIITSNNQTLINNIEIYYNKIWSNYVIESNNEKIIDGNHFLNHLRR